VKRKHAGGIGAFDEAPEQCVRIESTLRQFSASEALSGAVARVWPISRPQNLSPMISLTMIACANRISRIRGVCAINLRSPARRITARRCAAVGIGTSGGAE